MKQFLLAVVLSTATVPGQIVYWSIWGPLDVSSQTVASSTVITSTVTAPVMLKATSGDCWILHSAPNGSLFTTWTKCQ